MSIEKYRKAFEENLEHLRLNTEPVNLYEPVRYIMTLGGKRIRPVLTLLSTEGFGKSIIDAMPAATAIEFFHNFTLLHDDIMDQAEMRRGKKTVHQKWNENTAILSGDVMVFLAQKFLESYSPEVYTGLQKLLNQTAIEICEGQQEDLDFENKDMVNIYEYMQMIRKKTAVLLGAALQFGAIIAQKNTHEQKIVYEAGISLGLSFQIADDYLDTFGNTLFGKEIGGDIKESKKTFLYVKTLEKIKINQREDFIKLYNEKHKTKEDIDKIKQIFEDNGLDTICRNEILLHTKNFIHLINSSALGTESKTELIHLAEELMERKV